MNAASRTLQTLSRRSLGQVLARHSSVLAGNRMTIMMKKQSPSSFILQSSRSFSAGSNLSSLLAREIEEEESEMPEDAEEFIKDVSGDWTIVDDAESGTVKMVRKSGHKVTIIFHCQDTVEEDYDEEEEDEDEPSAEVRFTLMVTKAGKSMVCTCVAVDATVMVEAVATSSEPLENILAGGKVGTALYQGPEFGELEGDVQDAFHEFVQTECGVNADVAAFISMYSDYKEQQEYIRWMKTVKSILD